MGSIDYKKREKELGLDKYFEELRKEHGSSFAGFAADTNQFIEKVPVITTGILALDQALQIGGLPKGRIVEIYGPEGKGKTTLAGTIIGSAHKENPTSLSAFIDAEFSVNIPYFKRLGVDPERLLLFKPNKAEDALSIILDLLRLQKLDYIVLDSVAALVPEGELSRDVGDPLVGKVPKLMSENIKKMVSLAAQTGTTIIFINQIRMNINTSGYGSPEVTSGGRALPYYATIRMDIRSTAVHKVNEVPVGIKTKITIKKNKLANPNSFATPTLLYGIGFDIYEDLIKQSVAAGLLQKSGSWFSYAGERIGQGQSTVVDFLKAHPEIFEVLRKVLLENAAEISFVDETTGEISSTVSSSPVEETE